MTAKGLQWKLYCILIHSISTGKLWLRTFCKMTIMGMTYRQVCTKNHKIIMTFISVSMKSYPYQDLQLNKNYHHQNKQTKKPTRNQNQATNQKKKKSLKQNHLWPQYKYTQEKGDQYLVLSRNSEIHWKLKWKLKADQYIALFHPKIKYVESWAIYSMYYLNNEWVL